MKNTKSNTHQCKTAKQFSLHEVLRKDVARLTNELAAMKDKGRETNTFYDVFWRAIQEECTVKSLENKKLREGIAEWRRIANGRLDLLTKATARMMELGISSREQTWPALAVTINLLEEIEEVIRAERFRLKSLVEE